MSLYTWLNYTPEGRSYCFPYDYYAPRGGLLPPPPPPPQRPSTIVPSKEQYSDEIRQSIINHFANATEELITLITNTTLSILDPKIENNIDQKVMEAFSLLGAITNEEIDEITSS